MNDEQFQPPAGWYPDPKMAGTQRYWDGRRWSNNVAPMDRASFRQPKEGAPESLVTAGYVTMVLMPIVGLVIGIIVLSKGDGKAGGWMLGVSATLMTLVFVAASSSTYAGY